MNLFLLVIVFFTNFILSAPSLYEDNYCSQKSREFTDRITLSVQQVPTEAGAPSCADCSSPNNTLGPIQPLAEIISPDNAPFTIPDICFYAGMLRSTAFDNSYFQCQNNSISNPPDPSKENAPCLTEDYVKMTAQAFNQTADCFGFNDKEKKDLFSTINHESGYILNIRSKTKAICYGQITSRLFQDLNKYIYARNDRRTWNNYGEAVNQVFEKCPHLKNKVVPQKVMTALESSQNYKKCYSAQPCHNCCNQDPVKYCYFKPVNDPPKYKQCGSDSECTCCDKKGDCQPCSDKCKGRSSPCQSCSNCSDELTDQAPMTCALTSDPYSCLFYSMLNLKLNMIEFDRWYNYHPTYLSSNVEVEEEFIEKYGSTLRRNQVYIAKGKLIGGITGNLFDNMLFSDYVEMYEILPHYREGTIIEEHKPVTLFDPEDLRTHFTHTAHNGGRTIANEHFVAFMGNIKRKISAADYCNNNPDCKRLRDKLLSGTSLSLSDLRKEWKKWYLAKVQRYPKKLNKEAADFMSNADKDLQDILTPKHLDEYLDKRSKEDNGIKAEIEKQCSFLKD